VTFYTARNHIFYLELAIDRTEFIRLYDFVPQAELEPDELMEQAREAADSAPMVPAPAAGNDTDDLLKSLGM
jgi:hypothetical protein